VCQEGDESGPLRVSGAVPEPIVVASSLVEQALDEFFETAFREWGSIDPQFKQPLLELRQFIGSGGKRIRPAFCYWSAVGFGSNESDPSVLAAMVGLELLHSFALIHDDVMDRSDFRRGVPALHKRFEADHRDRMLRGSPEQYGCALAVLVGDLAHALADEVFSALAKEVRSIFSRLKLEVDLGQYLDIVGGASEAFDVTTSKTISLYKSAKYTIERPMQIGAAVANGCGEACQMTISAFAVPLGLAFQLKDDLLGVFGDTSLTKKPVGDDLREGKPTVLVALARQSLRPEELVIFESLFGQPELSEADVATLQELIVASGARSRVEQQIDDYFQEAVQALDLLQLVPEARSALREMAAFVVERDG
jgi:geranylgeranyl diphosphate synthase type I